jgi:multisubunit Na+/H+ antiporter MnhB subunit
LSGGVVGLYFLCKYIQSKAISVDILIVLLSFIAVYMITVLTIIFIVKKQSFKEYLKNIILNTFKVSIYPLIIAVAIVLFGMLLLPKFVTMDLFAYASVLCLGLAIYVFTYIVNGNNYCRYYVHYFNEHFLARIKKITKN